MNELKKKIIKKYIILTLILVVIISILDNIFDSFILNSNNTSIKFTVAFIIYVLAHIIAFYYVAHFFYKLISLDIDKEKEANNEELNLLFANIGHDIKTPLTSINGYAKAILDNRVKEDEKNKYIEIILNKGERINTLLNALLSYTKLNRGMNSLSKEKVEINSFIREKIASIYYDFEDKNLNLEINLSEENIYAQIDKNEFLRVLDNLTSNMIKYSPKDSSCEIRGKVLIDKTYRLSFLDLGEKLNSWDLFELIKPFYRKEEDRSKEGYGLGLAITNKIIELHGFKLGIQTQNIAPFNKAIYIDIKFITIE